MVFKPDFSFSPRDPATPTGLRSRSVSPKASCGRTPYLEDGGVSPWSKNPSIMSSWSSKRSSMTSVASSVRRECHPSVSTESVVLGNGPLISPIRIRFDESYGFEEEDDNEGDVEKKRNWGKASTIKTSIFRGFNPFPFHSSKMKKAGSTPTSPKSPETLPVPTKQANQTTRATVNVRFRLFKSAPKSTKNNRRPPPLNLQSPQKLISPSRPVREAKKPFLASPIKLGTSALPSGDYDFAKSPEAGVQLLFQTLSEKSDQENVPVAEHTKEKEGQSSGQITETTVTKFPKLFFNVYESIPRSPISPPRSLQKYITESISAAEKPLLRPAPPVIQPPTPCFTGSPDSFLFDDDEETDIEDPLAYFCTREPSPATSRKSSFSISRRASFSVPRTSASGSSSISRSRKSSVATFFCRGQRPSFDRSNSIGLGGLSGDEVEIKDDAESIFYPGISEIKSQSSWLYTNPPEYSSSDDEDDFEIEEAYQRHLSLITKIHNKSASSLAASVGSTPELTMSSSISSVSSYGQMLATPPRRRNRRRTASSECIVLEALEKMEAVGLKDPGCLGKKSVKGLGLLGDMDFGSEWTDALWEMDSDEQVGSDWETQQRTLISV